MKGRALEALFRRYLLPALPGFGFRKSLLYSQPIGNILRGFSFDSSRFDANTFYVEAFVQPLYVPSTFIYYLFGQRLTSRTGQLWRITPETETAVILDVLASLKKEGLPFINYIRSPRDLGEKASLVGGRSDIPHAMEAVAYSLVLAGEDAKALAALDQLDALCRIHLASAPYLGETVQRSATIRASLTHDPPAAIALLQQWCVQTRTALRLPEEG